MPTESTEKQAELRVQDILVLRRNASLRARFKTLYDKKRMRHDDVLAQLEQEYFITQRTIRGILKTDDHTPLPPLPGEQIALF